MCGYAGKLMPDSRTANACENGLTSLACAPDFGFSELAHRAETHRELNKGSGRLPLGPELKEKGSAGTQLVIALTAFVSTHLKSMAKVVVPNCATPQSTTCRCLSSLPSSKSLDAFPTVFLRAIWLQFAPTSHRR